MSGGRKALLPSLVLVAASLGLTVDERVFGLLTDGQVMTRTAIALAELGEIGVARGHQVDVVRPAGDAVTRYGLGPSLVQVPAAFLARRVESWLGAGASQTLFALEQVLLVLLAAWAAGSLARSWGGDVAGRRAVLALGLSSPLWAYVSSDFSEPLQAALVGGTFALAVAAARAAVPVRRLALAALAGACAGFALLTKSVFVVLLPFLLVALAGSGTAPDRVRLALAAVAGWALFAGLWLAFELVRFGRPFASYVGERFSHPLLDGLWRLTVGPNKGLLLYFPLAVLAVAGLVKLLRSEPGPALAAGGLTAFLLVTTACWWAWDGTAGWGPRLLVPSLPLLAAFAAVASVPSSGGATGRLGLPAFAFWALFAAGAAVNLVGALVPDALTTFYYGVLPPQELDEKEAALYPSFAYERGPDGRARLFSVHAAHRLAAASPLRVAPWLLRVRLAGGDVLATLRTPPWPTDREELRPARPLTEAIPPTALVFFTAPFRWPHLGTSLARGGRASDTALAYVDGLYDQALRAQDMGRGDRAASFGERLYRLAPSPRTAVAYAEGLRLAGRRQEFAALVDRLPRDHKVLPELGVVMALFLRDVGDEERARMVLFSVLRAAPAYRRLAESPPRDWPALRELTRPVSAEPSGGRRSEASGG